MFIRSILIPSLIVCAIAAPILFSQAKKGPNSAQRQNNLQAGFENSPNAWAPTLQTNGFGGTIQQASSANYQTAPNSNVIFQNANQLQNPAPTLLPTGTSTNQPISSGSPPPYQLGGTPDYGSANTVIYPGDANGPDLTAMPLEFMPVTNLEEIFNFDVTPNWVTSRWNRISTCPGDKGLHGLRVALVTGTNSWDLHGSLTYFFDGNQRAQRITFRGWAGDASNLTNLLTKRYGFKSQPTHWAGFFLAENRRKATGGVLMQHPTVIYTNNPVQQIAVVMEINNTQGKFLLSDEFHSLIAGSKTTQ